MKKVIALVLALVMVFALCACGSSDSASSTKREPPLRGHRHQGFAPLG